jgi:hypothetical protein
MGKGRRGKTADVVFEGVRIPKDTRSAKLAADGVGTVDEIGNFLTAVFVDTLKGKIVLPPPRATRVSAKVLNGREQKVMRVLPVKMSGKDLAIKRPRRAKLAGATTARTKADPPIRLRSGG